jgi:SNF2 family DNA or RNA helicase
MRDLFPQQADAMRFLAPRMSAALFMDMRLGKTLAMIRHLKKVRGHAVMTCPFRVLVAAPGSALGAWEKELTLEGETYSLLLGTTKRRQALLKEPSTYKLINKEGFLALPEIAKQTWSAVILDESTFIKSPMAKVTRFYLDNFRSVPRRYILTGTPNPEGDRDFSTQFIFLKGDFCGCSNYWQVRARWFTPNWTGYGWKPKDGFKEALQKELKQHALVIKRDDAKYGIRKAKESRRVALPPTARKAYLAAEKDFVLELPGHEEREMMWAVERYSALRQISNGFIPGSDEMFSPHKVQELVDLLAGELRGVHTVVWFTFNNALKACSAALLAARTPHVNLYGTRAKAIEDRDLRRFQAGQVPILLCQVKKADKGADLSAADTAIYFDEPLGLLSAQQSEDRIVNVRRPGNLLYLYLIVQGTIQERIHTLLKDKGLKSSIALYRALRESYLR